MKNFTKLFSLFGFIFFWNLSFAQPPAPGNDDPCSATVLTVNSSCTYTSTTNANATATSGVPAPGCANYVTADVWYQVTVPASGNLTFNSNTGVITDGGMAIYSGTCGSLTLVACDDDSSPNGLMPMISQAGLTPGSTIWIRFWEYGGDNNGSFSICVVDNGGGGGGPANDDPCNATVLTVGATCSYTASTNAGATQSAGVPSPGCASYMGGDVWFQVTVPASGNLVFDSNTGVITDGGMAIYSGTCGSLTLLACDDDASTNGAMPMIQQSGLTPGSTIWIMFWEYGNNNNGSFSICVYDAGGGGGAGSTCGNPVVISSLPFSASGQTTCGFGDDYDSGDACGSSYMNGDDFVYQYTPSTNQSIDVVLGNTSTWVGVFITQGCPGNAGSTCVASNTQSGGNPSVGCVALTAGQTYYITISTFPSPQCTPFDISVTASTSSAPTCNLNYTTSSIASSTTGGGGWTSLTFSDDRFADSYTNLGFTFCFDGVNYTQCLVSSNGYIIFPGCYTVVPNGTGTPTGYSPWSINAAIPNTTDAPRNAILLTWQDIDPSVTGTIRYKTVGTAPNRYFILQFSNVAMFQTSCNSLKFNGELRLYETTNNIEFAVVEKTLCPTWNDGAAILGLHNFSGTTAVVPAGHNFPTQWTETNTGYRFAPNCPDCNVVLAVHFIGVEAQWTDGKNEIMWGYESDELITSFVVEKSINGYEFEEIGIISSGEIINQNNFRFIDDNVLAPRNFYRIKAIDHDGVSSYSEIAIVNNQDVILDNLWPNPHEDKFNVSITSAKDKNITVEITDITGRVIYKNKEKAVKGVNTFELNTSAFSSGTYLLNIRDENGMLMISKNIQKH